MRALLALAVVALASCATLSDEQCRAGDWRAIGFRDGAAGRLESFLARHAEACAEIGVRPDVAAWRQGRAEGLGLYCTPRNAYDRGRRGRSLAPVCIGYDQRALARAEIEGRQIYEVEREINALQDDLRGIDARVDDLRDGDVTDDDRDRIRRYRREADFVRSRIRLLQLEALTYPRFP